MRTVYVDNAATTAMSDKAISAMTPYLKEIYGNPSSLHTSGQIAKEALDEARARVAKCLNADPREIYFTSCGSESDNQAIRSAAVNGLKKGKKHIITTAFEHHAVLHTLKKLEKEGFEVTYLDVHENGIITAEQVEKAIRADTALVTVMYANNEVGTIQPIRRIGEVCSKHGVVFHTDAVQAVGHIPIHVDDQQIDLLSASAHKFNGPKGIGFLYVREGTEIESLLHGGGQEDGMRAGTENVAGIVGMAVALKEHMETMAEDAARCETLRMQFFEALQKTSLDFIVNSGDPHIPGSVSLSFCDAEGEMLLHRLDLMGIAVSTGSACNSKETTLSHVVQAIGLPERYRKGTIRITLGIENEAQEIEKIADSISRILCR